MADEVFPFHELARSMAEDGWGCTDVTEDTAKESLRTDAAGACLFEIVRRLNQAIQAWAADEREKKEEKDRKPPEWALPVPEAKVGDVYFSCNDLETGVEPVIVVARIDGYARVVGANCGGPRTWLTWLDKDDYRTEAEALAAQAKNDIAYHEAKLALAKRALAVAESGEDIAEFRGGVEIETDAGECE